MDSKSHVKAMIEAIRTGSASESSVQFESAMKARLNSALDERKMAVAAQIYGKKD